MYSGKIIIDYKGHRHGEIMKFLKKINKRLVLFIVIIVAIIASIFLFASKAKKSGIIGNIDKISIGEDYNNTVILNKAVYIFNNSNLKSFDETGKQVFSKAVPINSGKMVGDKNNLVIFEGNKFSILNDEGKVEKNINMKYEILDIEVKNESIFVVGEKEISVYDLEGEKITSQKTKDRIATFDISKNKGELIVTTIDLVNGLYKSDIYLKDVEKNKFISQTFLNEIIMHSEYLNNEEYVLVSNKEILILEDFHINSKKRVVDFKGMGILNSNIYLLEGKNLNVYDFEFGLVNTTKLKDDYTRIYTDSQRVIVFNEKKCSEYARGKIKESVDIKDSQRIIINDNGLYFIHNNAISRADLLLGGN